MSEFFTQVTDFLGQRWAELLALVGGTAGIVAILTVAGRVLCSLIVAKISKKNNVPINTTLGEIQGRIAKIEQFIDNLPNALTEATKQALKEQKKAKRKAYKKIVEGKEEVEEKVQEIVEPIVEEVKEQVEEVKKEVDNTVKVVIKSE